VFSPWNGKGGWGKKMSKKRMNKATVRELLPYIIYVVGALLLVNGGMLYAIAVAGEKDEVYWVVFAANVLLLLSGIGLIVWQFFRYLLPVREVICHMEKEHMCYSQLSREIVGSLEEYKVCKLQLKQMESVVQTDFMEKLLNAEYKGRNQLLAEAENVGLEVYGHQYLVAVAGIYENVADEDVDVATIYESTRVLDNLKLAMEMEGGFRRIWFKKISYRRMILVMQLKEGQQIEEMILALREDFRRKYGVNIFWGIGRLCEDPLYLWKCREEANVAINCCDMGHVLVEYSPELEMGIKCYLPEVARRNLVSYIKAGNVDETRKIIVLLKNENCEKRKLSRNQFLSLNSKVIRMLGSFQDQDRYSIEDLMEPFNDFVLRDRGEDASHQEYFDQLEECCVKLCEGYSEDKKDKKNRLAGEIKDYIDQNYQDSNLSLSQIGAAFNISDSYVSLIFKEYVGVKFSAYVEEIRIRRAGRLLEDSSLTVREIAEQAGYTNEQSFRRAFKKVRGISPKDARDAADIRKSS